MQRSPRQRPASHETLWTAAELVAFAEAHELSGRRELVVLGLLLQGQRRESIARKLRLKLDTIHTYCKRIHKKLAAKDTGSILRMFIHFRDRLRQNHEQ
jgi:DNA-binding NarL/FixJ family response regulator